MAVRARSGFQASGAQFLDPAVLGRIDNLELLARTVVDGFLHGLHRSPHLGLSLDFAEHRAYMPGDDIRRIDWRLFARTDRFYVKQFDAETSANFVVVLDISKSMSFGTHSATQTRLRSLLGGGARVFLSEAARPRGARDLRRSHCRLDTALDTAPRTHPAQLGPTLSPVTPVLCAIR